MANQRVRVEWYHERVGRGYMVQVWDAEDDKNMGAVRQFDVELAYGGRQIVKMSKNCYGEKSAEYWYKNAIQYMRRLMFLLDGHDMAAHNKMCYSTDILGNTPKSKYEDKWAEENAKMNMLEDWIREHLNYHGEKSEIKDAMIREFDLGWLMK